MSRAQHKEVVVGTRSAPTDVLSSPLPELMKYSVTDNTPIVYVTQ